jgi:ribosome-associated protein
MPISKQLKNLQKTIIDALEALKAIDILVIDVHRLTTVADKMIICTGSSSRHAKSLAENLVIEVKKQGIKPLSVEGESDGEWILVDLGDIIVHIMLSRTRDFYGLENLWNLPKKTREK